MKRITRLTSIIASAYVLMFFSEYFFTNEEPAFTLVRALTSDVTDLLFLLEFTLIYAFFSYALLIALDMFKVRDIWGLVLAGSLFGWWTEGVIIPVLYEALPYTIFWPSIGWHALVDVLLGWYLIRRVLHLNRWHLSLFVMLVMGAFWGVWATWFTDDDVLPIDPAHFVMYVFFTSVLLIGSYRLMDRYRFEALFVSKFEVVIFLFITVTSLVLLSIGYGLVPWIVLIPLTGLTVFALSKGKNRPIAGHLSFDGTTSWWQYPLMLLIPSTASVLYALIHAHGEKPAIGELLPPLLMVLGAALYVIALCQNIRTDQDMTRKR